MNSSDPVDRDELSAVEKATRAPPRGRSRRRRVSTTGKGRVSTTCLWLSQKKDISGSTYTPWKGLFSIYLKSCLVYRCTVLLSSKSASSCSRYSISITSSFTSFFQTVYSDSPTALSISVAAPSSFFSVEAPSFSKSLAGESVISLCFSIRLHQSFATDLTSGESPREQENYLRVKGIGLYAWAGKLEYLSRLVRCRLISLVNSWRSD